MASTLADLTVLAQFEGTRVPAAPLNGPCLALFGQLLTHPSRVTFPWHPLRHALYTFFGSGPQHLDQSKIGSGWNGLSLILTAFKRLEVVESPEETNEVIAWLQAIKLATIRRSLEYEVTSVSTLQDILDKLAEPLSAEELNAARTQAHETAQNQFATGTAAASASGVGSGSGAASGSSAETAQPNGKRSSDASGKGSEPTTKKRKNSSNGSNSMSMSNLSSFPDIEGAEDPLQFSSSGSEDELDMSVNARVSGAGNPNRPKVQQLATRLSDVTGIPLQKCIETIARFPDEDLNAINPNAPIPAQFLPAGTSGAGSNRPAYKPTASSSSSVVTPASNARQRSQAPSQQAATQQPNYQQQQQAADSGASFEHVKSESGAAAGFDGEASSSTTTTTAPPKKASRPSVAGRAQRPHDPNRPSYSYSALIGQAILSVPEKRMRLSEIYDYVMKHYPYYQKNESGWQNSIRHNLSLQSVFRKMPDNTSANKKGCFWTIVETEEWRFANGGWTKSERNGSSTTSGGGGSSGAGASAGGASGSGAGGSVGMSKSRSKSKSGHSKAGSARSSSVPQDDGDADDDDDDERKTMMMEDVEGDPNAMTYSDDE